MISYRMGLDEKTGKPLGGYGHLVQSIAKIASTLPLERVMRLDFGLNAARYIGRNISPRLAANLYQEVIVAIHKWEPEYRIRRLQLIEVGRTGRLGILFEGDYFPEGRLGNYAIRESRSMNLPLMLSDLRGSA